jgi:hypothetical protein
VGLCGGREKRDKAVGRSIYTTTKMQDATCLAKLCTTHMDKLSFSVSTIASALKRVVVRVIAYEGDNLHETGWNA